MKKILLILLVVMFSGCSMFRQASKCVAGVSVEHLEKSKVDSIYQDYACDLSGCFDAVLDVAEKNEYYVFTKDRIRGLIVLMNIPGQVNTTEVGVFLTERARQEGVRVELSSRSTPAKRAVAKVLFNDLNQRFKK